MPHIIVEAPRKMSEDLNPLLRKLHDFLARQETVALQSIKTRCLLYEETILGDGNSDTLHIHITLRLLPGRSDELRRTMTTGLADIVREQFREIMVTAECVELHQPSYIK